MSVLLLIVEKHARYGTNRMETSIQIGNERLMRAGKRYSPVAGKRIQKSMTAANMKILRQLANQPLFDKLLLEAFLFGKEIGGLHKEKDTYYGYRPPVQSLPALHIPKSNPGTSPAAKLFYIMTGKLPPKSATAEKLEDVLQVLGHLSYRERELIKLRAGIEGDQFTLDQAAKVFKVTTKRIAQVEKKALEKLRSPYSIRHILPLLPKKLAEKLTWEIGIM